MITHTLGHLITGEITFDPPYRFTFHYADAMRVVVEPVIRMQVMTTGCYVCHLTDGRTYVVPPGYRFLVEEAIPIEHRHIDGPCSH